MAENRKFDPPVYKAATKDSFFEVYDGLDMERPKMGITITKIKDHKVTDKVSFYFDPQTFFGFCDAILANRIDDFISMDNVSEKLKGFPSIHYGLPKAGAKMRQWIMTKSHQTGSYQIAIQERERRDKWDKESPVTGQAAFYLTPFALITMASTSKSYLQRTLLAKQLRNEAPLAPPEDEEPLADVPLGME